jgi:hypothetical protein
MYQAHVLIQLGTGIMHTLDEWCAIQLPEPHEDVWTLDVIQDQACMSTSGWFRFTFQDPDLATLFVLSWSHVIVQVRDAQIPP